MVEYLESRCDRERGIWYSPVSLHGGDKGPTAMTPEDAYVIYDIRYVDETLQKEAEETLRSLKPKQANVHFEISGGMEKPPFLPVLAAAAMPTLPQPPAARPSVAWDSTATSCTIPRNML